jgi:hypothetical protein
LVQVDTAEFIRIKNFSFIVRFRNDTRLMAQRHRI